MEIRCNGMCYPWRDITLQYDKCITKNSASKFLLLSFVLLSFVAFVTPLQSAAALIDLGWEFSSYTLNDGAEGSPAVFFNVTDDSFANAVPDTITVTVESITPSATVRDSTTMTLSEIDDPFFRNPDPSTGIFGIKNLVFNPDAGRFSIGDTAVVTQHDASLAGNSITDTISLKVNSTTTTGGIQYILTETADTGVFTGKLTFSSSASIANSTIQVSAGDIVTVQYNSIPSNIAIAPSPDGSTSGLKADVGDTIRITYQGISADTTICVCGGPGGGGGGFIRPGLVLDVVAIVGGNGGRDFSPPSFVLNPLSLYRSSLPESILSVIHLQDSFKPLMPITDDSVEVPLRINNNGYALYGYSQTIETVTVKTGIPVPIRLSLQDNSGVEHVAMYTNIVDTDAEIQNSDTYIIFNKNEPLEIKDPHGLFSNVDFVENKIGSKYDVLFNITFSKPLETSDMIFRLWDEKRNSGDTKILDAIKVVGEPIVDSFDRGMIQTETAHFDLPYYKVPKLTMSFPEPDGKLMYYDSFGNLAIKQVHPLHQPYLYPDDLGMMKRIDSDFKQSIIIEDEKGRMIVQELIGNPIKVQGDKVKHLAFYYPSNIGKLDRGNIVLFNNTISSEIAKADRYFFTNYVTGDIQD